MNVLKPTLIIACLGMAACKKTPEPTVVKPPSEPTMVYNNYSALKVGNYWVYEDYRTDVVKDSAVALNTFDSSYVEKDTLINGHTYFKYCTMPPGQGYANPSVQYLRDSLSYIVSSYGSVRFSYDDFTTIFYDKPFGPNQSTPDTLNIRQQMTHKDVFITVPAGTFQASAFSNVYYYPPGSPKADIFESTWHAKNVGIVKRTWGFYPMEPHIHFEHRLVRYHVQ